MPEELEQTPQTEEQIDAELQAEWQKLQEPEEEVETTEEATEEVAETKTEEAKSETPEEMSEDEGDRIARDWLEKRGFKIALPGESEAEKEGAKEEGQTKAVVDVLEGLPDVDLPAEVVAAIEERFPGDHNAQKREVMYIRAAAKAAIEQESEKRANEKVAPILQDRENVMWQATAQTTAKDIAEKASVPEAAGPVAKYILSLGSQKEAEALYKNPALKEAIDAKIRDIVQGVGDSLEDSEQKEVPTAERVGGGKAEAEYSVDGLSGEAKSMAAMIRKDMESGMVSKAEGQQMLKELNKK